MILTGTRRRPGKASVIQRPEHDGSSQTFDSDDAKRAAIRTFPHQHGPRAVGRCQEPQSCFPRGAVLDPKTFQAGYEI